MTLPVSPLPQTSVSVNGAEVSIRSLSRSQALHMLAMTREGEDAEAYVLSVSTGETIEEATAWLDATENKVAADLIRAILVQSGLAEPDAPKATKPGRTEA